MAKPPTVAIMHSHCQERIAALEAENTRLEEGLRSVKAGLLNLVDVYPEIMPGLGVEDYKRSCQLLVRWCDGALEHADGD